MRQGNAGMWSGYVRNHLLPRIFGFESLMVPYAVAHFKLGMQLQYAELHDGNSLVGASVHANGTSVRKRALAA